MAAVRAIVELGRRVRTDTKVRVRQPLLEAVVHFPGDREALRPLLGLVADELNVKEVLFAESAERFGQWRAKPNFKVLGPRLGPRVKDVAAALEEDDGSTASALAGGAAVELATAAGPIRLDPGDVDLVQETLEGWGVASDGGLTVALELELTPELRREGLARELVRVVQDGRKAAGLQVSDRIALGIESSGEVAEALEEHRSTVAEETLAIDLRNVEIREAIYRLDVEIEGSPVAVTIRPA
jgi:isoleucyl-tRNA synthetase